MVVTAGPAGAATVVVCCVVVAGLGCSTRSDLTEQADVAAIRKIKMDTRISKASVHGDAPSLQREAASLKVQLSDGCTR